jgi:DNA repair protein RadD
MTGALLSPPTGSPTITLRPYQREAIEAVYDHLRQRDDNPAVVLPTAAGKTMVIGTICRDTVEHWNGRILILAHVKELLEQAVDKLHAMAPDLWHRIGVYSAGLGSRDTEHSIIVAGIQSVYRRAQELGRFDLVLIDEAHMVPPDGEGMYRTFLADAKAINPNVRLIGLTATPFRMTTGTICSPENLLNKVCYEVSVRELIVQGYLCPLVAKGTREDLDTSGLHVRAGEFVADEVEALMDQQSRVEAACAEIVEQTKDRHSVLVFAGGIQHAQHVSETLQRMGGQVATVFGETPDDERARTIAEFRAGRLKYLVNVGILTHGFDAPNIDCVALLRPTNSPGLYYQCCGRGFRLHPGKSNCLILDFGGNVLRHGPVDDLRIKENGKGTGEAPAKKCPECLALIATGYAVCPQCGYAFPPPERQGHDARASTAAVLSGEVTVETYPVQEVAYSVHVKRGAPEDHPRSTRVDYRIGFSRWQSEWVCFEHTGYARHKAEAWWRRRSELPVPDSAEDAVYFARRGALAPTKSITVRHVSGEEFDHIVGYELGEKPFYREPGWDDDADAGEAMASAIVPAGRQVDDAEDIPF